MNTDYTNTTASGLLAELKQRLETGYAIERSATVAVAADPAHAMELLAAGRPGGTAVVLFYMSDLPLADEAGLVEDTAVEGRIRIGVIRHRGLAAKPASTAPAALAEAEALRSAMAQIADAATLSGGYEYGGMSYISNAAGELLHGYILEYKALYAYVVPPQEDEY